MLLKAFFLQFGQYSKASAFSKQNANLVMEVTGNSFTWYLKFLVHHIASRTVNECHTSIVITSSNVMWFCTSCGVNTVFLIIGLLVKKPI